MPPSEAYDLRPYTAHAYAESHPDRLAVVARLAGWQPPPLAGARVLELGCGRGGNLLPMASSLPGATLVGVDLSSRAIDEARQAATETGAVRASFEIADAATFTAHPPFDYVVCHGVASWVAPEVRRALLRTIGRALAPGGLAYVSINTLPGWYDRLGARDFLRAFPGDDPRGALSWLGDAVGPTQPDSQRRLRRVLDRLRETDPAYAVHEYLADEHHPMLLKDFLGDADGAGLTFLGDAVPSETALELLPEGVRARAARLGPEDAAQLADFVRNTAFRRVVLVRRADAASRGFSAPRDLRAEALGELRLASRLVPHARAAPEAATERFDAPGDSVELDDAALRRALHLLAAAAPRSLPFAELATGAGAGSTFPVDLLDLVLATGAVDLHAHEPPLADASGPRALACPVARWSARNGLPITNLRHHEVRVDDPLLREVLLLADGRTQEALTAALRSVAAASALSPAERADVVHSALFALARAGLLLDAPPEG